MLQPRMLPGISFLTLSAIIAIMLIVTVAETEGRQKPRLTEIDGVKCAPCDRRRCPVVTPETCQGGQIMKDQCDCCPVCSYNNTMPTVEPGLPLPTKIVEQHPEDDACASVQCAKPHVCIRNIQGIPICGCRNKFFCRREKTGGKEEVCGDNGILYRNKCHLEVDECKASKKIRIVNRNMCNGGGPTNDRLEDGLEDRLEARQDKKVDRKAWKRKSNGKQIPPVRRADRQEKRRQREERREGRKADRKEEKKLEKREDRREEKKTHKRRFKHKKKKELKKEKRVRKGEDKLGRRKRF